MPGTARIASALSMPVLVSMRAMTRVRSFAARGRQDLRHAGAEELEIHDAERRLAAPQLLTHRVCQHITLLAPMRHGDSDASRRRLELAQRLVVERNSRLRSLGTAAPLDL